MSNFVAAYAAGRGGAKATERAVLVIQGRVFEDWETVAVKHQIASPMYHFRFTCSEGVPLPANYPKLQIKPSDVCEIYLAGYKAFSGKVTTRQVFYDAHRHHIEIQGSSHAALVTQTSHLSKTGEMKDVTFEQICRKILAPLNIPFQKIGQLPQFKFPRVSIMPGQFGWEVIEQYARSVGAIITSNVNGDFVAIGSGAQGGGGDKVVEGQNILEGREVIWDDSYSEKAGSGQMPPSDATHGPIVTSKPWAKSQSTSEVQKSNIVVVPSEIPVGWTKDQLQQRVDFESQTVDRDSIFVTVTVYGWLKSSGGGLWGPPGQTTVTVQSPMLMMKGTSLKLRSVTFTQDDRSGTRSVLELMNDKAMGQGYPQIPSSSSGNGGNAPSGGSGYEGGTPGYAG